MTPAQRRFIVKTLSVVGWLALGLYVVAILWVTVVAGWDDVLEAVAVAAVMSSPVLGVGIVCLWVRRFLVLGNSED